MHDSENVQVPIGPQHPALKEPTSFTLTLQGEKILQMGVRLGYNHRGIEKACEERTYIQDLYLIERICGICSHSHSTALSRPSRRSPAWRSPSGPSTSAPLSPSWSESTATCCGWAWPGTRSASTRC